MLGNLELVSRLVLAAALGSVIGVERGRLSWAAGLRTHRLVCVGSALTMIVSAFGFADALGAQNVVLDPSRMAAQVVSGIGFLGAGSILMRVKQFVMQQSDGAPENDVVTITLHRVSTTEYAAIRERLRQLPCVKEFREDDSTS